MSEMLNPLEYPILITKRVSSLIFFSKYRDKQFITNKPPLSYLSLYNLLICIPV
jgi:hypothetical protein